ncbi:cytochrome c oxidase subunit 3 [Chitinophaga japonensis]|uniref:Cytochrome c oxidase subunit 3/cytochrome c oxidase subunit I+III n=1 Tax=Chitinophaga japonensis TaxID=104662 RepID=A0A562STC6_CHIJA|nr:cytochrome c oxidase subunit 3 [Chitinophaga japonensis]TWI84462.1 cytochrome c oxidase subunit 3/cytochrome c oxidase subunit I+III [Chitinophaga japonensis]
MHKLMMKLAIGSEAVFFISLLLGYLHFWNSGDFDQVARQQLDIRTAIPFTLVLLSSSITFLVAEKHHRKGVSGKALFWLLCTACLGLVFLSGQGYEYFRLIRKEQVTVSSSVFGSAFFALTGFHGLHVLTGIIALLYLSWLSTLENGKRSAAAAIGAIGIYWHFVDVVWIAVFSTVYLLPYIL